ncbi:hypothetical protein [Nocardia sp. NBC_01009]|uniref:hypothetical protein n=1 Tax=Nocardia sp. NBC_01009 TaxID=2975996 RepID=UPI00386BFF68|nr:hypothetical protein OHA42_19940 [Nocardia sp. NBC_01009]
MSGTDTTVNVQLIKLARTFGIPVDQLTSLADVSVSDLRDFRFQIADLFFEGQSEGLRRVVAASKVIPNPIIAKLVTRNHNALFAAKTSEVLEVSNAVDVAKRLPADFLADVAAHLDARRSAPMIAGLPAATVVAVAEVLAARQDWITLGDLVATISDDAARATEAALDGVALVRAAYWADDARHLERFVNLASAAKLTEMLRAAAEHDLWSEYRPTLDALSESAVEAVRTAAEQLPSDLRDRALAEIADRRAMS